jgi:hypothetical protein
MSEPMIKLDPAGKAPILSYNVSDAVSYSSRYFLSIVLPGMNDTWFKPPRATQPGLTTGPRPIPPYRFPADFNTISTAVLTGLRRVSATGLQDARAACWQLARAAAAPENARRSAR